MFPPLKYLSVYSPVIVPPPANPFEFFPISVVISYFKGIWFLKNNYNYWSFSNYRISIGNWDRLHRRKNKQKKTNESLAMAIDELASLTKIQEVAAEQGLSYNNSNIKSVVEDS